MRSTKRLGAYLVNHAPRRIRDLLYRHVRVNSPASLFEAFTESRSWNLSATDLFGSVAPGESIDQFLAEYHALGSPRGMVLDQYPATYDLEFESGCFLYCYVRARKPVCLVETGVARGASTSILIEALIRNGAGHLVSIDIATGLEKTIDGRGMWTYEKTDGTLDALEEILTRLGGADLFLHDSDHSYQHQLGELTLAWKTLRPEGIVAIDDADWSNATLDFITQREIVLHSLLDRRKLFGVLTR